MKNSISNALQRDMNKVLAQFETMSSSAHNEPSIASAEKQVEKSHDKEEKEESPAFPTEVSFYSLILLL